MVRHRCRSVILACTLCLPVTILAVDRQPAQTGGQEEEVFALEPENEQDLDASEARTFWDKFEENLRLNIDIISRIETTRQRGEVATFNAIGLDMHKVITGREGDIGTLVLQPYIVRRDNALPVPPHVEDDDDWELEFHDFYFNLTKWSRGRLNVRLGHFDVPFGLEPLVDTHFTLHQLIPFQNIGMKKDWGLSLNGALPRFDYEISASTGSGFELTNRGKNFLAAGRIGTPSDQNFVIGASVLYGQVIDPHRIHRWQLGIRPQTRVEQLLGRFPQAGRGDEQVIRRLRYGIDLSWIFDQYTFRAEASGGRDYDQDVFNSLIELNWVSVEQEVTAYMQAIYLGQRAAFGWEEDVIARVGAVWQINENWSVSGQYRDDLRTFGPRPHDGKFTMQMRYRF